MAKIDFRRCDRSYGLRELPIELPGEPVLDNDQFPFVANWKLFWLGHWYSPSFRGRLGLRDYARRNGVSPQAAWLMAKAGRLGDVVRDASGRYWVPWDWPYPELVRVGGYARRGSPDLTVRPLWHSDFVRAGYGPFGSAQELESYCRAMWVPQRQTLEQYLA